MTDGDFWDDAWTAGVVPARSNIDPTLEKHWPPLGVAKGSRVLVPLSGKSADLTWLASRGYEPVGVEISAIPCAEYFAERNVEADRAECGRFVRWHGGGVTILQGDFFDLAGTYDAAVDRGALVAVAPSDRTKYARQLNACLTAGAPVVLLTIEFDPTRRVRPPYPVFPDEVERLFPGAVERARRPMNRPRWDHVGGATTVVWTASSS